MSDRTFNAGWLVGAVLLSSWAVSSASDQARPKPAAAATAAAFALPRESADLDAQISRLADWTTAQATPTTKRNPFTLDRPRAMRASKAVAISEPAAVDAIASVAAVPKLPSLSGLASQAGVLTAIVSFNDSLHFVKSGDMIAGRYRVDSVSADAVELFDLTLGTILRLTLQSLT